MEIKRLRNLATEIFKTVNNLSPSFIKNIFTSKENAKVCPNNIVVKSHNSATYGDKSLMTLGPKIWNALPENIKSETSYKKFKEYIDLWFEPKCRCNICKSLYNRILHTATTIILKTQNLNNRDILFKNLFL